jgi:hypothetical protein
MGMHFVNFPLVLDGVLDPTRPESSSTNRCPAAPAADRGRLPVSPTPGTQRTPVRRSWAASCCTFEAPNRFGLPPFYTLHVWAWKENPTGAFVNWHANVSCEGFSGQNP